MKSVLAALLAALLASHAAADDFPSKPLRIVVPNPAGGTIDIVTRLLAQSMSVTLGQNVIVDIKPGGNTIIGTDAVARAPADGYTMVMVGALFVLNPLIRQVPYDSHKDFTPLARIASMASVIAVHPSVPAKSLQELVSLARAKPGQLNYATFGTGQLMGERLKSLAGIDLNYVPYQGGVQATISVVGGHAPVLVAPLSDATPYIASGKLRALAVTSRERSEMLKEVPTVAESGYPGFEWVGFMGALAPARTPKAVVERLSAAMLRAVQAPETQAAFARLSIAPAPLGPEAYQAFLREQTRSYEAVVRLANIKAD